MIFTSMQSQKKKGYITLMSVLIVTAVGVAMTVAVLLGGLSASRTSFATEQSNQTKALANACAEEALEQIKTTSSFTGTNSLSLGQGTCTYDVTSQGGQSRTITASGAVSTLTRKVEVIISTINPTITVISWQEVDAF